MAVNIIKVTPHTMGLVHVTSPLNSLHKETGRRDQSLVSATGFLSRNGQFA